MKMISVSRSFVLFRNALGLALAAAALAGCAGGGVLPDPRAPAPVRDSPQLLRVCFVEGDGAHLSVGDQVEFTTVKRGTLTIRHIPGPDNKSGVWNAGQAVEVRSAILVERIAPRANSKNVRRFVPVGRFTVQLADSSPHVPFDFLTSKATENLKNERYPECNASLGDDEVLIRGVKDQDRHDGGAHLR